MPTGREIPLDCLLGGRQAQFLEPADLQGRERLRRDVVERRPAPQRQRLAQRARRDELLEATCVDVAAAQAQLIAATARDDLRAVPARRQ